MECPTCGKTLQTRSGIRKHHTKVHSEPLPNRTCSGCGVEFYDPKSRLEFCDDCNPNAGEHNGNWQGATETSTCVECGDEFEYYPSNKDGMYCSACVEAAEGLLPENYAQENLGVERVTTSCPACGETQQVLPSILDSHERGIFCDLDCYGDWLSEHVVGENHHLWVDNESFYTHGWSKVQRAALARDDYKCQICGLSKAQIGRNPDVHHITPVREFEHPRDAHELENVICLCPSCHSKAESGEVAVPSPGRE